MSSIRFGNEHRHIHVFKQGNVILAITKANGYNIVSQVILKYVSCYFNSSSLVLLVTMIRGMSSASIRFSAGLASS